MTRYINRLPEDWVGISLYLITIITFSVGIVVIVIKSKVKSG
jgi:hypothetical protein